MVHDERGDVSGHLKVLLRVIDSDVQVELLAALDEPREQFVDAIFFSHWSTGRRNS